MYDDVPAKYDSQSPQWSLKVAELATAWISVDDVANPGLLAHVPPERFAARSAAAVPMVNLLLKRNVRSVSLGNGIYPSSALAKQFGMPQEELARAFWGGVDTDYGKLQETGAAVKTVLAGGREVHITSPYGTDLRVRVEGRPVYVSDGVISSDDMQRGGPACQVWLPAGEVYLAPIPGTANGIVLVERQNYQDKEIVGMELSFKDGKLVSMKAKSGMEPFKARYDVAGAGKDEFAVIDIGINREVAVPPGRRMDAFMAAGMVAVNLGNNEWAGGTNNSEFGWTCFLPNATLTVDGNVLVERGKLKDVLASGR
jgi:leucyl aminopeptidase (aminopeptidase T)